MLNKSLEELDGEDWGEPAYDSYVVRTCHALRRKPIGDLTTEEIRLAINQNIGLQWLLPLAIENLRKDPFISGDFFEGDLLKVTLSVPGPVWERHRDWQQDVHLIAKTFFSKAGGQDDSWRKTCLPGIAAAYESFCQTENETVAAHLIQPI
jgi:hypothetical protein